MIRPTVFRLVRENRTFLFVERVFSVIIFSEMRPPSFNGWAKPRHSGVIIVAIITQHNKTQQLLFPQINLRCLTVAGRSRSWPVLVSFGVYPYDHRQHYHSSLLSLPTPIAN